MSGPRRLVLMRHAESEGNLLSVEERVQLDKSTHEYKLTKRGRNQAKLSGEWLRANFPCGFDAYYSSYYERALETLSIACPGAVPKEDPRLAEAQRGIWHTMSKEEIEKIFPHEIVRRKREGLYHYRPLGGENWPDIEMRIQSFRNTLACEHDDETVLVIVHGNWHSLFRKINDGMSVKEVMKRYNPDNPGVVENASVTTYKTKAIGGKSRLVLQKENIIPWEGRLCVVCDGRGQILEGDKNEDGITPCGECGGTGLK